MEWTEKNLLAMEITTGIAPPNPRSWFNEAMSLVLECLELHAGRVVGCGLGLPFRPGRGAVDCSSPTEASEWVLGTWSEEVFAIKPGDFD
jgi:hypothetical protein